MRRTPGLGEGKLGCIVWAVLLALASLIAYKTIPVKLASAQLYDYMDDQARFGARISPDALKARILRRAKELKVPVVAKNVKVQKRGGMIRMECKYTVPVEVLGFTYDWDFNLVVDRQIFIF